jgi:hypothetical protein
MMVIGKRKNAKADIWSAIKLELILISGVSATSHSCLMDSWRYFFPQNKLQNVCPTRNS